MLANEAVDIRSSKYVKILLPINVKYRIIVQLNWLKVMKSTHFYQSASAIWAHSSRTTWHGKLNFRLQIFNIKCNWWYHFKVKRLTVKGHGHQTSRSPLKKCTITNQGMVTLFLNLVVTLQPRGTIYREVGQLKGQKVKVMSSWRMTQLAVYRIKS